MGEKDLRKIQVGQAVRVSGMAFDKENYTGTLTYVSPSARQQVSGTTTETVVDAVVTLQETDASLRPGLTAKASVVTGSVPDVIIAAYEDVLQDEEGNEYLFVYRNGRACKRVIITGSERSEGFEIVSGLEAGKPSSPPPRRGMARRAAGSAFRSGLREGNVWGKYSAAR